MGKHTDGIHQFDRGLDLRPVRLDEDRQVPHKARVDLVRHDVWDFPEELRRTQLDTGLALIARLVDFQPIDIYDSWSSLKRKERHLWVR